MVGSFAVHAALVLALFVLIELLEAIFGIGIILDVVALVLLNVTLVLECECAARTPGRKNKKQKKIISHYGTPLQSHLSTAVLLGGMRRIHMVQMLHKGGMITEAVQ